MRKRLMGVYLDNLKRAALVLALVVSCAPAFAQDAVPNAQSGPGLDAGELRKRLYVISQMIQTTRLDEAEQSIALLRTEAGQNPLIDGLEAFLTYRRHDFSGARDMVEKALKTPQPPTWWHTLDAMCMVAMGEEAAAKETLAKSQTADPKGSNDSLVSMVAAALHDFNQTPSVEGSLVLSFLDGQMGSRHAQLNVLDQGLHRFPKDPRLIVARLRLLGDAATDQKQLIAETDKAAADAPEDDVVQTVAGELYDKLGAFDKGLVVLQKAVKLNPKNYAAHMELGNAYRNAKKHQEALAEFEAVVAAQPPVSSAMLALAYGGVGTALSDLKRWQEAEAALQKGSELAPDSSVVLNNLAWLYATADPPIRNPDKAVELGLKAVSISRSRQPSVLDTLAEAYFSSGNKTKAVETEKRALLLAPNRSDLQDHLKKYEAMADK